jgi:hypothetical protein
LVRNVHTVREPTDAAAKAVSDAMMHHIHRRRITLVVSALHSTIDVQPGQRYRATDPGTPLATSELVIDRLVRDALGMLHVVLLDLDGREISLFADQFEAAVVTGYLVADDAPVRVYA